MPTAQVNIRYVNAPKGMSKYGSLKDANDEYWSVPSAMLGQFAPNQSVMVEYDTTQKDGKTYKNIKRLVIGGPAASAVPQARYQEDPVKAEQIAVLAIVKEWVGKIPVGDTAGLVHALRSAREAWKQAYAKPLPTRIESGLPGSPIRTPDEEFNDDLPEAFR